jgi:anti-sigma regulatory factor (Ser/Thr protein kinase)
VTAIDVQLEGGANAPGEARRLIRSRLGPLLSEEEAFELELLVTELVTNAVRHGGMGEGRRVGLVMRVAGDSLRLEVRDSGPGFKAADRPHPRDFEQGGGGFGLVLLDRFARRWGVDRSGGARVWADIPRREAPA